MSSSAYIFSQNKSNWTKGKVYGTYNWDTETICYLIFNIFGLVWNISIIIGSLNFVICSSVCYWYFTPNRTKGNRVWTSLGILLEFHLGTICLGSLLIVITWVVQVLLNMVMSIFRGSEDNRNQVQNCIAKCCSCCVECIEGY